MSPRFFILGDHSKILNVIIREALHAHIPLLAANSTVRDAVDKMAIYQFQALVVVDEGQFPIAVVTEGDLCRAVGQRDSFSEMQNEPVLIHATHDPRYVSGEVEIGEAFHLMVGSGLTLLPVVDDGILSGIVTRIDLMEALFLDSFSEDKK